MDVQDLLFVLNKWKTVNVGGREEQWCILSHEREDTRNPIPFTTLVRKHPQRENIFYNNGELKEGILEFVRPIGEGLNETLKLEVMSTGGISGIIESNEEKYDFDSIQTIGFFTTWLANPSPSHWLPGFTRKTKVLIKDEYRDENVLTIKWNEDSVSFEKDPEEAISHLSSLAIIVINLSWTIEKHESTYDLLLTAEAKDAGFIIRFLKVKEEERVENIFAKGTICRGKPFSRSSRIGEMHILNS